MFGPLEIYIVPYSVLFKRWGRKGEQCRFLGFWISPLTFLRDTSIEAWKLNCKHVLQLVLPDDWYQFYDHSKRSVTELFNPSSFWHPDVSQASKNCYLSSQGQMPEECLSVRILCTIQHAGPHPKNKSPACIMCAHGHQQSNSPNAVRNVQSREEIL